MCSRLVLAKGRLTFVIKAVYPVDTRAFVVSSQNEEVFGVFDLVCKKKADCFERLFATVDVIAQEKVVRFWWESTVLEQPEQVIVLPVDIACPSGR